MLEALIQSKTRLKLVLKFFLNPENKPYLRGLAKELGESTNSVRVELNRFEESGLISSYVSGNKKFYQVNREFPLYKELRNITFKHLGIDQVLEKVINKLGQVEAVFLTGDLAKGLDSSVIDITIVGEKVDKVFLARLVIKAEKIVERKIRTIVYRRNEEIKLAKPYLLIFGNYKITNKALIQ